MKSRTKIVMRGVFTGALLGCVLAIALSPYFHLIANHVYFVFTSLISTTILLLRIRPRLSEVALLLLSTTLLYVVSMRMEPFPPRIYLLISFMGLASTAMLGLRALWTEGEDRKLFLWAFVPAVLYVGFGWLTPLALQWTASLHPRVLDLYLYYFDCSLRMQPSFLMGEAFLKWPLLHRVSYWFYISLPVVMTTVYVDQLLRKKEKALPVMLAFIFSGPFGALFYNFFPALGPLYVFRDNFPLHPLSLQMAGRLLLEPIAVAGAPNAMPSLHMTWVVLAWWYSEGCSWWTRAVAFCFLVFTAMGTLGTGEHYLVDLVVAFPFALWILATFAFSRTWNDRGRVWAFLAGAGGTFLWLWVLRYNVQLFWVTPVIPWLFIIITVGGVAYLRILLLRDAPSEAPVVAETNPAPVLQY